MDAYISDRLQRTMSGALAILVVTSAAAMLAVAPTAGSTSPASSHAVTHAQALCTSLPEVTVTARRIDPGAGLLVATDRRHPAGIT